MKIFSAKALAYITFGPVFTVGLAAFYARTFIYRSAGYNLIVAVAHIALFVFIHFVIRPRTAKSSPKIVGVAQFATAGAALVFLVRSAVLYFTSN